MSEDIVEEVPAAPAAKRPWVHSAVYGIVILLCGAAIGSVTTALLIERPGDHGPRRGEHLPEQIAQKMQERYGLNETQRQQIQAIFEEHIKNLSAIRADVQPRMDAAHEALRGKVEAVLTPEQAARWREEYENMRRPWHARDGGPPPPPSKPKP